METLLTPSMLVLAREAKGWTQRDLAAESGISQAVISKIESGAVDVSTDRLSLLAGVLNCPPSLLCRSSVRVDSANTCLHHRRRRSKLSASATKKIEGIAHLTRVSVEGIFDGIHAQLETDVDPAEVLAEVRARTGETVDAVADDNAELDAAEEFDPSRADAAARYLRQQWKLDGPIENLIGTLEEHGILVVYRSLGSRSQDGVSSWPANLTQPPIIVVNEDLPPDRVRFTVAHELAHLLLHRAPSENAEKEANRFAGEFLVPEADIVSELTGLTTGDLARLTGLKNEWGASIGMLIQRAKDVGTISDRQFREFRVRLTKLGWDVNEPGNLTPERPTLLAKAIAIGGNDLGLSVDQLAAMALMTPSSFAWHFLRHTQEDAEPRQVLNLNSGTNSSDGPARPSSHSRTHGGT
jgi:Zn-dependent peptidase ImmA (M78 family)/DNA-binding Xre family transcriptional regulator